MANENESRLRFKEADSDDKQLVRQDAGSGDGPARRVGDAPGSAVAAVESEVDRIAREREEAAEALRRWKKGVDNFEPLLEGQSSPAYRRALAVYDPRENNVQLAELWEYKSSHLDRFGRF